MPQELCRFKGGCENTGCRYHHLSPAAKFKPPPGELKSGMCNQGVKCMTPACQFNHPSPKLWPPHASPQASFGASAGRGAGGRGAHPAQADFEPKVAFEPRPAFDTLGRGAGRGRGAAAVPSVSWTPQANLGLVSGKTEPGLKASQEIDNPLKSVSAAAFIKCVARHEIMSL